MSTVFFSVAQESGFCIVLSKSASMAAEIEVLKKLLDTEVVSIDLKPIHRAGVARYHAGRVRWVDKYVIAHTLFDTCRRIWTDYEWLPHRCT
jgi:predicted nucleic-acid-binding protein